jgi:hypothetical protein
VRTEKSYNLGFIDSLSSANTPNARTRRSGPFATKRLHGVYGKGIFQPSVKCRCCGYCRLHMLLKRDDHIVNQEKLLRLYREEERAVRRRVGRNRAIGTRTPVLMGLGPLPFNQRMKFAGHIVCYRPTICDRSCEPPRQLVGWKSRSRRLSDSRATRANIWN